MRRQQCHVAWVVKNFWWVIVPFASLLPVESYGQTQYVQPIDWTKYAGKTGVQPATLLGKR